MMMKTVLFMFHSNSDYLIAHMQTFLYHGIYALLSVLPAVLAWLIVYQCMKKTSEKKRILVATLAAVLVAILADVIIGRFLIREIRNFVYTLPLSDLNFPSFFN